MKYFIFTMSLFALVSCKDSKSQESNTETENVEQTIEAKEHHHNDETTNVYDNSWTKEIVMNNGEKWEANDETNEGVKQMQNSLKAVQSETIEDYHELANQLNESKNYVIKNCTMKGASHDNLHVWLLPLISKIEALSDAKTLEDASKTKHSIEENVNAYNNYFQ